MPMSCCERSASSWISAGQTEERSAKKDAVVQVVAVDLVSGPTRHSNRSMRREPLQFPSMKALMLGLAFVAACGASQKEVAVQGADLDLARVAGDWDGEYKGTESGRTGQVSFSLQVGSHVAE